MLWSRPERAQPPIVDVVKWTLAAARSACASDNEIQSVADGTCQSACLAGLEPAGAAGPLGIPLPSPPEGGFGDASSPFPDVASPEGLASVAAASLEASAEDDSLLDEAAERRSFFAHPEPLKWTAGEEIAFLTGPPPQRAHASGASAWTPWMTSKRRPQAAQS